MEIEYMTSTGWEKTIMQKKQNTIDANKSSHSMKQDWMEQCGIWSLEQREGRPPLIYEFLARAPF